MRKISQYKILVQGDVDTTPPELKSIEIENNNKTVYAPGTLKMKVNATDDKPNNIKHIQIDIYKKGTDSHGNSSTSCVGDDSGYTCTLEVDQYFDTGEYFIRSVYLTDNSNNMSIYFAEPKYPNELRMDMVDFVVDTETKSDVITSTINDELLNKIKEAKDDATISIDSTRYSTIKKEIFDTIKDTNKKIIIESNGIQWIFSGQNITNETKDIDVKVNIYQNEAKDDDSALNSVNSVVVDFAKNGLLPGVAKIRIKADYVFRNYIGITNLYIYYYDEENELLDPVAQKIDMTEDGYYEFYIDHNSKYMIANNIPDKKFVSNNTSNLAINAKESTNSNYEVDEKNNININNDEILTDGGKKKDDNNTIIIIVAIVCALLVLVAVFIIFKKKKTKKENKVENETTNEETKVEENTTIKETKVEDTNEVSNNDNNS